MKEILKLLLKNKVWFILFTINWCIMSFVTGYTIFTISRLNGIENFLRLVISIILIIVWLLICLFSIRRILMFNSKKVKYNHKKYVVINIILLAISLLYAFGLYFISNNVDRVMNKIGNVSSTKTTYSSSLIALKDNKANKIEEIGDSKIGILIDEKSYEGYIIPQEVLDELNIENELELYNNYIDALASLYKGEIEYIFVPTNYSVLFSSIEGYEDLKSDTKILYTKTKEVNSSITVNSKGTLDEPFTVLLMGVDSELENIKGASFNGDSLMLITFNPDTLNSTILSIPRDTYTNITCMARQRKNKITHAAWQGESCMIDTIEELTDVQIDYYVKINFKGVVNLVDAVGGVEVDVPYAFCEQNSDRAWGEYTVFVEKGYQTLNGEQALAFARNRHTWPDKCGPKYSNYVSNDFIRGQNQQTVVKALLNKLKSVRDLNTLYDILDTISNSMETNMSTNEILSLYNIGKKALAQNSSAAVEDIINIQRLYLSGYDQYIYDYDQYNGSGTRLNLYNYVPYKGSIEDISNAMKVNLGLLEQTVIKEFEFDVDNEYEETVIGKGKYNEAGIALLSNLVGMTESEARAYATKNGLKIKVNYVSATNSSQKKGMVVDQDIPAKADLEYIHTVTIDVINTEYSSESDNDIDCSLEENKDSTSCAVKTFIGSTIDYTKKWFSKYDILVEYIEIKEDDEEYDSEKAGKVVKQSATSGSLYDYLGTGKKFTITYMAKSSEE